MVWENFGSIEGQPSDGTAVLNVRAAKTQKRRNLSGEQRTLNHPPLISWNGLCYSLRLNTVSLIVLCAATERESTLFREVADSVRKLSNDTLHSLHKLQGGDL